MTSTPRSVIIVGGSLAGLMHGVYFKRHGSDVVILEQDPSELRSSHQAGIAFGPAVEEFLRKYDHTGVQSRSPPIATRLAYRKRKDIKRLSIVRHETSWGLLYRVLRANFDGLASDAVPNPPPVRDGDGRAQYLAGRRATGLEHNRGDQVVSVRFVDQDGKEGSLTADLVIGADGGNSTVRTLLQAPTIRGYSGYVAWRGTVPEKDVSPETARYFADFSTLTLLGDTYFVCYPIPPDTPTFSPGTRLINWVWYWNLAESSSEMADILMDTAGRVHGTTVPAGLVRPEAWKRQLARTVSRVTAPLAELLSATPPSAVFVTKVNDALCEASPVFCDGKVLLVGDAFAHFRPHLTMATEQAAWHCLGLEKVRQGEMEMDQWAKEARVYAKRMHLASYLVGVFGVGRWWELLKTVCQYVVFMVRLNLRRG